MTEKELFNKICRDIKSIKIQGAENIAEAGFRAYKLIPTKKSKKKLLNLRPTEPMLRNVLEIVDKISYSQLISRLNENQFTINKKVFQLIKNKQIIFIFCHSSTIIKSLIYAKKQGKKFEVYNTETRPLLQGRKTAKELVKAGIKTTMFVDSAIEIALTKSQDKEQKTKPVDIIFLGADAITRKGVINKVGSGMIGELARANKIPIYIISNSLKFTNKPVKFEQRNSKEVWKFNSKNINIKNPAFEFVDKKDIKAIISEFGILNYNKFLKRVRGKKL